MNIAWKPALFRQLSELATFKLVNLVIQREETVLHYFIPGSNKKGGAFRPEADTATTAVTCCHLSLSIEAVE